MYKNAIDKIKIRWYYYGRCERCITIHPKGNKEIEGQPIPVKEVQSNKQETESFLAKKKNKDFQTMLSYINNDKKRR